MGSRIPIKAILAMLTATLYNRLLVSCLKKSPNFTFEVPMLVPSVDSCLLVLRGTWDNRETYDLKIDDHVNMLANNISILYTLLKIIFEPFLLVKE